MQNNSPEPEKVSPFQLDQNMKIDHAGTDEWLWYSPLEEPFRVSGFAWFDTERIYRRLPAVPEVPVRPEVDTLANCTSGGQIRFRTDSRHVSVRVRLKAGSGMYHMPPPGSAEWMRISAARASGNMQEPPGSSQDRQSMRAAFSLSRTAKHARSCSTCPYTRALRRSGSEWSREPRSLRRSPMIPAREW